MCKIMQLVSVRPGFKTRSVYMVSMSELFLKILRHLSRNCYQNEALLSDILGEEYLQIKKHSSKSDQVGSCPETMA